MGVLCCCPKRISIFPQQNEYTEDVTQSLSTCSTLREAIYLASLAQQKLIQNKINGVPE